MAGLDQNKQQYRLSSGGEKLINLFLPENKNFIIVWAALLDQTVPSYNDVGGVVNPIAAILEDTRSDVEPSGPPAVSGVVDAEGPAQAPTSTIVSKIEVITEEEVLSTDKLLFTLRKDTAIGDIFYETTFTGTAYSIGDRVEFNIPTFSTFPQQIVFGRVTKMRNEVQSTLLARESVTPGQLYIKIFFHVYQDREVLFDNIILSDVDINHRKFSRYATDTTGGPLTVTAASDVNAPLFIYDKDSSFNTNSATFEILDEFDVLLYSFILDKKDKSYGISKYPIDGFWYINEIGDGETIKIDAIGLKASEEFVEENTIDGPTIVGSNAYISSTLVLDQNNWNPTGFQLLGEILITFIFINPNGVNVDITGLLAPSPGIINIVSLVNVGVANRFKLLKNNASSDAANQFNFKNDEAVEPGQSITIVYYPTNSRWLVKNTGT